MGNEVLGIFDTGTSFTMIPKSYFVAFVKKLIEFAFYE